MENLNVNATVQNSSDAEALEALFDKYEKRNDKSKKLSKEQILAKYFNPRQDTEIFRALPIRKRGDEIIDEGWFHKVQAGKFAKNTTAVYCPAKNNPKVQAIDKKTNELVFDQKNNPVMVDAYCPICAKAISMRRKMHKNVPTKDKISTASDEDKKKYEENRVILSSSNKFESKRYYIIRGIDRGAEKDGVKFWRFKENFKSQGVHDKLMPIVKDYYKQTGKAYSDQENGIDLMISVVDNEFNGSRYRDVSAIIPRIPSKLHTDALIAKQWLDDKITWKDVFKPKKAPGIDEIKYLELASEERELGQKYDMRNTPYYDEEHKKWIFPNHPDLEIAANTRNQNLDADEEEDQVLLEDDALANAAINTVLKQGLDITEMSTAEPTGQGFNHGSVEIGSQEKQNSGNSPYDDLPF